MHLIQYLMLVSMFTSSTVLFQLPFGGEASIKIVEMDDLFSKGKWSQELYPFTPQYSDSIWIGESGGVIEKFNHLGHGVWYESFQDFKKLQEENIKYLRGFEEGTFHGVFFQLDPKSTERILQEVSFKEPQTDADDSHRTIYFDDGRVLSLSKSSGWGELFANIEGYKYYVKNYLQGEDLIVPIPDPKD